MTNRTPLFSKSDWTCIEERGNVFGNTASEPFHRLRRRYRTTKFGRDDECALPDCSNPVKHAVFKPGTAVYEKRYLCENCLLEAVATAAKFLPAEFVHAIVEEQSVGIAERKLKIEREESRRLGKQTPGWVYYLEVGDLIKIGFTIDLRQRLDSYPPNMTVLAVHPGTPEVETKMHRKFRMSLEKGREWFKPSLAIKEHTQKVRDEYGTLEDQFPDIFEYGRKWNTVA